jgi:hypothetical protein
MSKSHVELPPRKRNRSQSSVLSWTPKFPPNACRGERCGVWGRTAPIIPVQSHSVEGFIRFMGFPEREEQYGQLSCDGDDSPLLGLSVPSRVRGSPCSRRALWAPKDPRIYCAALTSRRRRYRSPHLESIALVVLTALPFSTAPLQRLEPSRFVGVCERARFREV